MQITQLIPIGKAASLIGLKRTTIYERLRSGDLQAVKIGNRTFLEETEIARFRAANARIIGRQDHPPQKAA